MRRTVALVLSLVLVAGACSGGENDVASSTTTTTTEKSTTTTEVIDETTTTTAPPPAEESVATSSECPGIGALTGEADVTWISDGRVWAAAPDGSGRRCLAKFAGPPSLQWGGAADRLLAGERSVLLADGPTNVVPDDVAAIGWSRPTGKALLARGEDRSITKLALDGAAALRLNVFTEGDVVYHPAGTAIAVVSTRGDATAPPDLLLADNRGENVKWLVTNETADAIDDLVFSSSGAAIFSARHGDSVHVHRLVLGSESLEYLLETDGVVGALVASPYHEGLIAAGRTACNDVTNTTTWLNDGSTVGDLEATDAANGEPVGWLPDGSLVTLVHPDGCDDEPGDLYVVAGGEATLIASNVDAAAVRAELPPPPPPPPEIEAAPA